MSRWCARERVRGCACLCPPALKPDGGQCSCPTAGNAAAPTPVLGEVACPVRSMETHGHRGHLDTYVMGAWADFPATAPQRGRSAPPCPSGTPLPILRLVVFAARRVCCALTVFIRSEGRIVAFLCGCGWHGRGRGMLVLQCRPFVGIVFWRPATGAFVSVRPHVVDLLLDALPAFMF